MRIDPALRSKIKKKLVQQLRNPQEREVVVKTSFKLSKDELNSLKESVPSLNKAELINQVDPELLGGLVIVDGSLIIDYSIKGKINEVVQNLSI